MNSLIRLAQEFEDKLDKQNKAGKQFAGYVGMLRGLSLIHQHAHWTSKNKEYYGDHLLFDRLYGDTVKHIDDAAEKMIGVYGIEHASLVTHVANAAKFINDIDNETEDGDNLLVRRALLAEEVFLKFSKSLYAWLEERDILTLGVDDMIMSIASDHEGFVYLLKQRLSE